MNVNNAKRNKRAGHDWERFIIDVLKERNLYPNAITTRQGSRQLDGSGIDIMNSNEVIDGIMDDTIQAKAYSTCVPYPALLERLYLSGRKNPVVFHRHATRDEGGNKFLARGLYAISYMDVYVDGMAARQAINKIRSSAEIDAGAKAIIEDILKSFHI